jgi:hypothetical protein
VDENVNYILENSIEVPQNLKTKLLYDVAIFLLGIYPRDMRSVSQVLRYRYIYHAALVTIAL